MLNTKKVCIIGGGFAGIQVALNLAKSGINDVQITLISNRPHFEYYPALHGYLSIDGPVPYHIVPLKDIIGNKPIELVVDTVITCDLDTKTVTLEKGETISADFIVLAVGSETTYFGIEGLAGMAFPFQNTTHAKNLRAHVQTLFQKHCDGKDVADCVVGLHFVIVGAGPNGVDLAGELATYAKYLCKQHNVSESLVTIDLIEGASGVLPMMPRAVQDIATKRLRSLGVNILCNRQLMKQGSWTVALSDMTLGAKTLIWTAGTTGNALVTKIPNIVLQKKNRISVNQNLEIEQHENCFVAGDIADTQYAGLAQTAIHDGHYIAGVIKNRIKGKPVSSYMPKPVAYNIGVGHGWSITKIGNIVISGKISSLLRRLIDLKYFLSILPWKKVWMLSPLRKNPS